MVLKSFNHEVPHLFNKLTDQLPHKLFADSFAFGNVRSDLKFVVKIVENVPEHLSQVCFLDTEVLQE